MELKTYFAQDAAGNIISSAVVNVFLQGTNTLATGLTRADGTPLDNPFAADGAGRIQFRAPDGYYDVQVSAGSGIIQTLTIQCVDYSGAKADADRAEAAADRADVSAEQVANAIALRGELADPSKGDVLLAMQQQFSGAVERTQHDFNAQFVTLLDAKAKGDGETNDTDAFTLYESWITGRDVDLLGKTYLVDSIPTGNRYYNGQWALVTGDSRNRWQGAQLTGAGRIVFGDGALASLPLSYDTGENGVVLAIGYKALNKASQVRQAIAIGPSAMENSIIARDSVAIGVSALRNLQARNPNYSQTQLQGTRMIGIGGNAGYFAVDAYNMVIIGRNAGHCVEGGYGLVAIGAAAVSGYAVVGLSGEIENGAPWGVDGQAIRTVGIGWAALAGNLAVSNAAVGGEALFNNKRSNNNSAFGAKALYSLDIDTGHTGGTFTEKDIAGTYSHSGNVLTLNFTSHGAAAGDKVQIRLLDGGSATFAGDQPIATVVSVIDANSFTVNHPKSSTASGSAHLYGIETAAQKARNENNTAAGASAGANIRTGAFLTLMGCEAAIGATTATRATLAGYQVGGAATSIANSALVGTFCATNMTTINNVTAIGDSSLRFKVDGTNLTEAWSNIAGIGSNTRISGQNQMQLGDTNINVYTQSPIQVRSDARDKARVRPTDLGIDFILGLKPVKGRWNPRENYFEEQQFEVGVDAEGNPVFDTRLVFNEADYLAQTKIREREHEWFLAQDIDALCKALGKDFSGLQHGSHNGGCDVYSLAYEPFIPPMVKAQQQTWYRIDGQDEEIAELKGCIAKLTERLEQLEMAA